MSKILPISGYPEWLPQQKRFEQALMGRLAEQLELCGFLPVETRAVEPLSTLLSKGDDKEIYVLKRLHATADEVEKLGLHFDLTVPFARYVEQFQADLVFPFKRYQMQKVWRGERKQEGRYREFMQCDLDIVGQNQLPLHFDAEMALLLQQLLAVFPKAIAEKYQLKLGHRKILQGFYAGLGVAQITEALRCVDKLAKIGAEAVLELLMKEAGLSVQQAEKALALGQVQSPDEGFAEAVQVLGVSHPMLDEGIAELSETIRLIRAGTGAGAQTNISVDLSIARGLDYYTGTVYEGFLEGHTHIGAICSGGRYDQLVGGEKKSLPGVGVSIGLTRLLGYGFDHQLIDWQMPSVVQVLVIITDDSMRLAANAVAATLRNRGIGADVFHQTQNFGKQIRHAEKRGIPYVWFVKEGLVGEVKQLATGKQLAVDANTWQPAKVT